MDQYIQFLKYLSSLQECIVKPGLDRVVSACERLGNPEAEFKSVHIAGTNGKGSVAVFTESIVRNNGYKVGLYTSPHLIDVRERVQINRKMISKEDIARYGNMVREKCEDLHLSYFEFLTLISFLYFRDKGVDVAILETGLGGRWDATNIVHPLLSVLTPIAIDHASYLGSDIEDIAKEKCGIIKKENKVLTSKQTPEVMSIIRERCLEVGAELFEMSDQKPISVSLSGKHQAENAILALFAAKLLDGYKIEIRPEYLEVDWPGRLQKISSDPEIILDGAHNIHATRALVDYMEDSYRGRDIIVVFGCMKDKNIHEMLDRLRSIAKYFIFYNIPGSRAVRFEEDVVNSPKEAILKAMSLRTKEPVVLVTGSLYLIGEFLKG